MSDTKRRSTKAVIEDALANRGLVEFGRKLLVKQTDGEVLRKQLAATQGRLLDKQNEILKLNIARKRGIMGHPVGSEERRAVERAHEAAMKKPMEELKELAILVKSLARHITSARFKATANKEWVSLSAGPKSKLQALDKARQAEHDMAIRLLDQEGRAKGLAKLAGLPAVSTEIMEKAGVKELAAEVKKLTKKRVAAQKLFDDAMKAHTQGRKTMTTSVAHILALK